MLDTEKIKILMDGCIQAALTRDDRIRRPYVGALVLSSSDELISMGIKRFLEGTDELYIHAERDAINQAGPRAKGATLITTLEPCIKNSRSMLKACSVLIAESGIKRVIIGMQDPSPFINGRGICYLRREGIQVDLYPGDKSSLQDLLQPTYHK